MIISYQLYLYKCAIRLQNLYKLNTYWFGPLLCTLFRLNWAMTRREQWGEINDDTCSWVGSTQQTSDQKSSTLPLDYCAALHNRYIYLKIIYMYDINLEKPKTTKSVLHSSYSNTIITIKIKILWSRQTKDMPITLRCIYVLGCVFNIQCTWPSSFPYNIWSRRILKDQIKV